MTFGRFNPVTIGHQMMFDTILEKANELGYDYRILASTKKDQFKNPFTIKDKLLYMRLGMPDHADKIHPHAGNFIQAIQSVDSDYDNLVVYVGADRMAEVEKILNRYNGKEFHFQSINVFCAGEREGSGISGVSASRVRECAIDGLHREMFKLLPKELPVNRMWSIYYAIRNVCKRGKVNGKTSKLRRRSNRSLVQRG